MKTRIYCKPTSKGIHSFFLETDNGEFYLFAQPYRKSVQRYFSKGILIKDAYDYSKAKGDFAITHTLTKLPASIRYIENEYDIIILEKTRRSASLPCRRNRLAA